MYKEMRRKRMKAGGKGGERATEIKSDREGIYV